MTQNDRIASHDTRCACCMDDRSWTCVLVGVITFGFIGGCIAALIVTQTGLMEYYRPTPYVPPNKAFSVDYLSQGYRYDFYKEKETYENAHRICELHNTSLLMFNSSQEEKEIDCYLNVRNNAEEEQLTLWLNETVIFGGPHMYARLASFFSHNREEVVLKTIQVFAENGCDIQKNFAENQEMWTADQENNSTETTYYIEKLYGNNGLRSMTQGGTNGCWNLVRWNLALAKKHNFICKSQQADEIVDKVSYWGYNQHKSFAKMYCNT